TVYQYGLAWDELIQFFESNGVLNFSATLANRFIQESERDLESGRIKIWRHKLRRRSTRMLIEVFETEGYSWKAHGEEANRFLSAEMKLLHAKYAENLLRSGKGDGTRSLYETLARQFLRYVHSEMNKNITDVQLNDIGSFIPYLTRSYQSTSLRTVLSTLRSFLKYLYKERITNKN